MEVRVTTAPEPRTRPGMMPSLVFGTPGTPAVVGLFAEVEAEGVTLQVSRLDGETDWTVDAAFRGSMPLFANGFGARYLRTKVVTAEVAAELDAAAAPPAPGLLAVGQRVTTEYGEGVVRASSTRRVVVDLDAGDGPLNVATGTPGYDRIRPAPERCFGHEAIGHRCTDLCTATSCPCRAEVPA